MEMKKRGPVDAVRRKKREREKEWSIGMKADPNASRKQKDGSG